MTYTAKAETDGVGIEGETPILGVDYVDSILTIANTVDPKYLELHGYSDSADDTLTAKGAADGFGDIADPIDELPNYVAVQPPEPPATTITDEYLLLHGYATP